jgi:hypothetical protein
LPISFAAFNDSSLIVGQAFAGNILQHCVVHSESGNPAPKVYNYGCVSVIAA